MFSIMIISYVIVAVLDTKKLFQNREYKKLAAYYILMLISLSIGTLIGMRIKIPSPATVIESLVNSILGK